MPRNTKRSDRLQLSFYIAIAAFLCVLLLAWYIFDAAVDNNVTSSIDIKPVFETEEGVSGGMAADGKRLLSDDYTPDEAAQVVSQIMYLPDGDVQVETVVNADGLRAESDENAAIYQYVKTGDIVFRHETGLIIYDPQAHKIVDALRFAPTDAEEESEEDSDGEE
jgi:hypothetical protein